MAAGLTVSPKITVQISQQGAQSTTNAIKNVSRATQTAGSQANRSTARFGALGTAINRAFSILTAYAFISGIRNIENAVTGLANSVAESVGDFQRLALVIETASARDLRSQLMEQEGIIISMDDAYKAVSGSADKYLTHVKNLALTRPISEQAIGDTFRVLSGYQMGVEAADALTEALVDFTLATGKTSQDTYHMSLALGQVWSKGKLAGEEMRQLTNAGITQEIIVTGLRKLYPQMGVTLTNFYDKMRAGALKAGPVLEAVLMELEDFGGRGKDLATTWAGIPTMFQNIHRVAARTLFGPTFQEMAKPLGEFIKLWDPGSAAMSNAERGLAALGKALGEKIRPHMEWIASEGVPAMARFFSGLQRGTGVINRLSTAFGEAFQMTGAGGNIFASLDVRDPEVEKKARDIAGNVAKSLSTGLLSQSITLGETFTSVMNYVFEAMPALGGIAEAVSEAIREVRSNEDLMNLAVKLGEDIGTAISNGIRSLFAEKFKFGRGFFGTAIQIWLLGQEFGGAIASGVASAFLKDLGIKLDPEEIRPHMINFLTAGLYFPLRLVGEGLIKPYIDSLLDPTTYGRPVPRPDLLPENYWTPEMIPFSYDPYPERTNIIDWFESVGNTIVEESGKLKNTIFETIGSIDDWIRDAFLGKGYEELGLVPEQQPFSYDPYPEDAFDKLKDAVTGLFTTESLGAEDGGLFGDLQPTFIGAGGSIITSLVSGITGSKWQIGPAIGQIRTDILTPLGYASGFPGLMKDRGADLSTKIVDGMESKKQDLVTGTDTNIVAPVRMGVADLEYESTRTHAIGSNLGANIINGIRDGIVNAWNAIGSIPGSPPWLIGVMENLLNKEAEAHSAAQRFVPLGENIVAGVIEGEMNMLPALQQATEDIVDSIGGYVPGFTPLPPMPGITPGIPTAPGAKWQWNRFQNLETYMPGLDQASDSTEKYMNTLERARQTHGMFDRELYETTDDVEDLAAATKKAVSALQGIIGAAFPSGGGAGAKGRPVGVEGLETWDEVKRRLEAAVQGKEGQEWFDKYRKVITTGDEGRDREAMRKDLERFAIDPLGITRKYEGQAGVEMMMSKGAQNIMDKIQGDINQTIMQQELVQSMMASPDMMNAVQQWADIKGIENLNEAFMELSGLTLPQVEKAMDGTFKETDKVASRFGDLADTSTKDLQEGSETVQSAFDGSLSAVRMASDYAAGAADNAYAKLMQLDGTVAVVTVVVETVGGGGGGGDLSPLGYTSEQNLTEAIGRYGGGGQRGFFGRVMGSGSGDIVPFAKMVEPGEIISIIPKKQANHMDVVPNRTVNIHVGNINNGMDLASLRHEIVRTVNGSIAAG